MTGFDGCGSDAMGGMRSLMTIRNMSSVALACAALAACPGRAAEVIIVEEESQVEALVQAVEAVQVGVEFDFGGDEEAQEGEDANEGMNAGNFIANVDENQIDQWVFRNQTLAAARKQAETSLQVRIDFINLAGPLSDLQRLKLTLAGQGDVSRFFDDFVALKATLPRGRVRQDAWQKMWQKIQPLQARHQKGLHGPGSLLQRTVKATLTAEQRTKFEVLDAERRRKHYDAAIRVALTTIETRIPLTVAQRKRLIDLLTTKSEPPARPLPQYGDYYYVMGALADMPEEDLKPIFVGVEWKTFSAMVTPFKGGQILRQIEAQDVQ